MGGMNPEKVRAWKSSQEAVNRVVDEERLNATFADRYAALIQLWERARLLGLFRPKEPDMVVIARWQRLRARASQKRG